MITVLTVVYFRQTTCPNSPSQHLGHHQTFCCDDVLTIWCSLRRSWWGVPSVLVYNFLFNHLFDGILRNWSFGLAKINKYLLQMGVNLGRDIIFFLKFFGLICVVYLIIWANWIYLGNFLFNLQLAKILEGQILQLNFILFYFFFRVVKNFFQGGPQPM